MSKCFTKSAFYEFSLERELALQFFAIVSRFEYALKAANFLIDRGNWIEVGWDNFANSIRERFDALLAKDQDFAEAVQYYLEQPPQKEYVRDDDELDWRQAEADENASIALRVIVLLRRVRNNLFHGGKHAAPDHTRDTALVVHAISILRACVEMDKEVHDFYFGYG